MMSSTVFAKSVENFNNLELLEFSNLKSNGAKSLYCLLKSSDKNSNSISLDDLKDLVLNDSLVKLDYLNKPIYFKDLEKDILKPIIAELSHEYNFGFNKKPFNNLRYKKETSQVGRGKNGKVKSLTFEWDE